MIVGHIGGSSSGGYEIQKSLRFQASASAYLSRTPGSNGSPTTCTWSGWLKRTPGVAQYCFSATLGAGGYNDNVSWFQIGSDDTPSIVNYVGNVYQCNLGNANYKMRDPSAWYHIVFQWNTTNATAALRARAWVNGVELALSGTQPAQNNTAWFNAATCLHTIGKDARNAQAGYWDGHLSEVNFIDGQALDPSYFGEFSAETGAWIPKKYTGTYGTNGFYLPFNDGSTLANLTADRSGNGNNWTANNISLTAGVTYDWMDDTPSNNFAVLNAVHAGRSTLTNGNLTASGTTDLPTIIPDSGAWYFERGGVSQTWTPPAAFPSGSGDYNFGQRPFAYSPPAGFKALCTKNLPTGTITTSGTFSGNASTDGPFVYLNGVPTAMTINGNAVTLGNHADKLANGFKVRSSSASYNSAGSNTYSITSTGTKFKYSNAQGNP